MQAVSEAAEGIRTLDLLHGKQNVRSRAFPRKSCKTAISGVESLGGAYQVSPRNHGSFRTQTGLVGSSASGLVDRPERYCSCAAVPSGAGARPRPIAIGSTAPVSRASAAVVEPSNWCLRSVDWWRRHWEGTGILDVEVADTMPEGRRLWLDRQRAVAPDNATEIATLEAEAGRFLADVRAVVRRTELRLERPVVLTAARGDPRRVRRRSRPSARGRVGARGGQIRFSPRARASSAPGGGTTALSAGGYISAPRVEGLRPVPPAERIGR